MVGVAGETASERQHPPPYMTPRLARWRAYTDGLLLVLAIGTLPLLLLELKMSQLPYWDRILLNAANLVVLIAFAVDYFVEFALAGDRRSYVRHEWTSALIVAAQAIALIPGLAGFGALRALRAARVFRLLAIVLRGVALGGAIAREGREVLRRNAVRFALGLAGLTWLMAAVGFTLAEDVGDGRRVHSFGDALWWSLCTITTVGYGDIYPITPIGRLVGGFAMVVGVSTFAVVTARAAQFLIRSDADTG